jgi:hypothetical protein
VKTSSQVLRSLSLVVSAILLAFGAVSYSSFSGNAATSNLGSVLVHVVNPISGEQILPTTVSLPGKPTTSIQVVACRDEYEPASFVVRPMVRDLENLRISVSDLVGGSGSIASSHLDVRFVKVWFQAGGGWNTIGLSHMGQTKVLVPELLLKDDGLVQVNEESKANFIRLKFPSGIKLVSVSEPAVQSGRIVASITEFPINDTTELQPVTIRRGDAKQLWLTVHVPVDARDGSYSGKLILTDDKGLRENLEITLQVLPVDLHAPRIQYSIYYRGTLSEVPSISSEKKGETQFFAELTNMLTHGVVNPTVYQSLDRVGLRRTLEMRKRVGLDPSTLFYLGTGTGNPKTPEELDGLRRRVKALKQITGEQGVENTYLYGIDEAKGEKLVSQRKAWQLVRNEGVKVFTAGYAETFPVVGDLLDLLVMAGKLQKTQAENIHGAGHKIFSYANPQTGPENPEIFRRNYGFELWRNNYDGAMPYAYQDSMGFIWNDFDHARYRDHNFTYPTVDGVIDTLAWEGFREGVDDVRYVTTLEDMLERIPKPLPSPAVEALHYLQRLRGGIPSNLVEVRSEIIQHILRLSPLRNARAISAPSELRGQ